MGPVRRLLGLIIVLTLVAAVINWPKSPGINLKLGQWQWSRDLKFKPGLDIAGGVHLALEAHISQVAREGRDEALQ